MQNNVKLYSIIIGALAVVAATVFGITYPSVQTIRWAFAKTLALKERALELDNWQVQAKSFKDQYVDYQKAFTKVGNGLVDDQNPTDFVEFLENIAAQNRLKITKSLVVDASLPKNTLAMSILVKGDFPEIVDFIHALEHGTFMVAIRMATIKKGDAPVNKDDVAYQAQGSFTVHALARESAK